MLREPKRYTGGKKYTYGYTGIDKEKRSDATNGDYAAAK